MNTPIWIPSVEDFMKEAKWIDRQILEIDQDRLQDLANQARDITVHSYAPYSNYHVGVALLSTSRKIYCGVNAERASYSETDHAEESAITQGIIAGEVVSSGRKFIQAIAVSSIGKSAPCGRCRQIIAEHCDNAIIVIADETGAIHTVTSLRSILPLSFSPTDLGIE
jgi:cytidine deaminase